MQAVRFSILLIRDTNTYVFLRVLRNFKEHHLEEHLRTTASNFMNKNRNNSSKKKLKVQSCKLYNNKYLIASTHITNSEVFRIIVVLVFKLLSRKGLFINRKDNINC